MTDEIKINAVTDAELTRLSKAGSWLTGAISVLVFAAGLSVVAISFFVKAPIERESLRSDVDRLQTEAIRNLRVQVVRLRTEQRSINHALSQSSASAYTRVLASRLEDIARRQDRIEEAIQSNPGRALELPLLRNDLNNMREVNGQRLEAIKASVDQAYDINKWLLGTMGVTIIGLALSNLLSRKRPGV